METNIISKNMHQIQKYNIDTLGCAYNQKLKKTCDDFEAVFINNLLHTMRQTVQKSELFGGAQGEEIFQDLQDSAISKEMAKTNQMGLSQMLYQQLCR
ncbi:MAG: hypothetical protein DRP78_00195 [Candidatus Omnitrophota bacterium]|nr:MAG: hypothetical protein DRP78_00195 [Candidatus Omnitrophota bacterium]